MAFNFGAFIGGASENLVEMIKTKEAQLYKEEQDEKERLRQARVAAANQRRADDKAARETAQKLKLLNLSDDEISNVMKQGNTYANEVYNMGSTLIEKGYDARQLLNLPEPAGVPAAKAKKPISNLSAAEAAEFSNEVASQPSAKQTKTSDLEAAEPTLTEQKREGAAYTINYGYLRSALGPADEEQDTLDKAYAVAKQKALNAKTPKEKDKYDSLAAGYLEAIKEKDLALKEEDKVSGPFSDTTLNTAINGAFKRAREDLEFDVDQEGRIIGGLAGRTAENQTATIMAMQELITFNTGKDSAILDENLFNYTKNQTTNAVNKLKAYGMRQAEGVDVAEGGKKSITDRRVNTLQTAIPVENIMENVHQYKVGDVIFVTENVGGVPRTSIRVYTGLNITKKHNMFVDAGYIDGK